MTASYVVAGADGVPIAVLGAGAPPGPVIVMSHATGFVKELFLPISDDLAEAGCRFDARLADTRFHGASGRGDQPLDWWDLGRDLLEVAGDDRPIGVGHSAGAAALVLAELLAPGTFSRLLLVEPIIFPGPIERTEHPFAQMALRRQHRFDDREAARDRFATRRLFAGWDDRMLDAYVAHGLVERDDVLSLACDPQDEAEFYRSAQAHGAFGRLGELDLPVTLMAGERSESHPRELMRVLSSRIRSSELQIVPDAGHFLPMQCPEVMVGWLQQHLPC